MKSGRKGLGGETPVLKTGRPSGPGSTPVPSADPFDYPLVRDTHASAWHAVMHEPYDAPTKRRVVAVEDEADFYCVQVLDVTWAPCVACDASLRAVYMRRGENADSGGDGSVYECLNCGATEAW